MSKKQSKQLLEDDATSRFIAAVADPTRVSGLTHSFYRYPARFSPVFARAAIEAFTNVGDVILDPFMGGGTTLVEARILGRIGVGVDISELSCFIARTKTNLLSKSDEAQIRSWFNQTCSDMNLRSVVKRPFDWINAGYQRNLNSSRTWPIRKSIELALERIPLLGTSKRRDFARAVILRSGQWALDCRMTVPSAEAFRNKMRKLMEEMLSGASEFRELASVADAVNKTKAGERTVILQGMAAELGLNPAINNIDPPKLILTSPPYPGVHVLYHRWQILGRKETPAPFWIANALDGNGAGFYSFGNRQQPELTKYFATAEASFRSLAQLATNETLFVQLVAFSDASWQLPKYLDCMERAGLEEVQLKKEIGNNGRFWRRVPNRKWYADQRTRGDAGKEVLLFHRVRQ